MPFSTDALGPMSVAWWRILAPLTTRQAKVLVVDLDNTLWGGVLGEDGVHGIQIGNDFPGVFYRSLQRTILDLSQRGIVLAISSKNNEPEALEALANHPGMLLRPQHFSSTRINWRPKAESIVEIAAELNVGVDAIAFLDDNPAEREAVRSMLPQVQVIELPADPARYSETVREFNGFERLTLSSEDSRRARYYLEEHQRRAEQAAAGTLEDFLHSLEIVVKMSPVDAASLGRAAQLTQKTNQFNLTTKRYTEADLSALLRTADWAIYTLSAQDRFGDNGIVGIAIMKCAANGPAEIDSLLLSCRVIGRGIERAFLALLAKAALAAGSRTMEGWFLPTAKNAPAANLYSDSGFECIEEGSNGSRRWKADLRSAQFAIPAWILTA
jgi:FkbH-like protein